jgi:hypothetical protein
MVPGPNRHLQRWTSAERQRKTPRQANAAGVSAKQRGLSPDERAHTTDAGNACAILCASEESGANYFESHDDPTVQVKRLSKRIEALGFQVTVAERVA